MSFDSQDFLTIDGTMYVPDFSGGGSPSPAAIVIPAGDVSAPWQSGVTKPVEWSGVGPGHSSAPFYVVTNAFVFHGGSGYVIGDILTISASGTPDATAQVTAVVSSVVSGLTVISDGHYLSDPAAGGPYATTGGSGSGCVVNVATFGPVSAGADTGTWEGCKGAFVSSFPTSMIVADPPYVVDSYNVNGSADLDPVSISSLPDAEILGSFVVPSGSGGTKVRGKLLRAREAVSPDPDTPSNPYHAASDAPANAGDDCNPAYMMFIINPLEEGPTDRGVRPVYSFIDNPDFNAQHFPPTVLPTSGFPPPAFAQKNHVLRLCLYWGKVKFTATP